MTPESVKAAAKASGMTLEEAQKILGVDRSASLQEVLKASTLLHCTFHCLRGCPECVVLGAWRVKAALVDGFLS